MHSKANIFTFIMFKKLIFFMQEMMFGTQQDLEL